MTYLVIKKNINITMIGSFIPKLYNLGFKVTSFTYSISNKKQGTLTIWRMIMFTQGVTQGKKWWGDQTILDLKFYINFGSCHSQSFRTDPATIVWVKIYNKCTLIHNLIQLDKLNSFPAIALSCKAQ